MNFKNIHIGEIIENRVRERNLEMPRLCNFFHCSEKDILNQFKNEALETTNLLKWSKILEYDFFRIYTQHLILYAPPTSVNKTVKDKTSTLPQFRKNIYTKEIIDFIMDMLESKEMTKTEVMERYNIPKTTLYKWISKYNKKAL